MDDFLEITIENIEDGEYFKSFTDEEKEEYYAVSECFITKSDDELLEKAKHGDDRVQRYAATELWILRIEDKIW